MEKKRFKMYKSGKAWVIAPILFLGLMGLLTTVDSQVVQADEIPQEIVLQQAPEESESNISEYSPQESSESPGADDVKPADEQSLNSDHVNTESSEPVQVEQINPTDNNSGNKFDQDQAALETTPDKKDSLPDEKDNQKDEKNTDEVADETNKNNGEEAIGANEKPTVQITEESSKNATSDTKSTVPTKATESTVTTQNKESSSRKQVATKATAKKVNIPIYRVYNPNSGEHLHTMNANERNYLVRLGWRDEGISMRVDGTGNQLFRLYNPNSGEHFYTLNGNERDNLKRHGWRYEGVAWRTPIKGLPMYRVFNPNSRGAGSHHYTMDIKEKNNLVKSGWRYEGVSWYTSGGSQPVASYVLLNAPFIDQQAAGFPMGCEAASLLQALHLKGYAKNYNLNSFIKQQPKSPNNNPNNGFSGDPGNIVSGVYHSIYAKPLAQWGSKYGKVADVSGYSVEDLKNELRKGNPVVVYVTLNFEAPRYGNYWWGKGINNAHIMTLDGFNEANQTYHVSDPNGKKGGKYWVSASRFEASYNARRSAVVVR